MVKNKVFSISILLIFFIIGCATIPHNVTLSPQINIIGSDVGKGRQVFLSVNDERDKTIIGHRGESFDAKITTNQNIANVIKIEIEKGLIKFNLVPVTIPDTLVSMTIEIRSLEYTHNVGFWAGTVYTRASLKVICKKDQKVFDRFYRVENERKVQLALPAKENSILINKDFYRSRTD